ncbi:hypothetical protein GX50_05641 [[Emmonsia] crescens]|uniref:Uncharacterized protein n=1 Tax=[Emmonsia] crescens TaxID=73230 RepID=A0A2B7ZED1_9EURO|nr:hypothetical protein GX50_05641 [Emmonsia crescens]
MKNQLNSNQSNSNQSNLPVSSVSHHLHGQALNYNSDSLIGKKIAVFLCTAKLVLKLINLNGSSNYLVWRESILFCVETVRCHLILNNEEEVSSFDEQQDTTFWTEQNEWLYFYIWNSLSPQALAYIEKPVKRSAYLLWCYIEIKPQIIGGGILTSFSSNLHYFSYK